MEIHDFSQLPVVRGKGTRPIRIISWKSIGRQLSSDPDSSLRDCVNRNFPEASLDEELISAIPRINEQGYIVVLGSDRAISGIVTSSDIGEALIHVARPFMLIEECESLLRSFVGALLDSNQITREALQKYVQTSKRQDFKSPEELALGDVTAMFCSREVIDKLSSHHDLLELGKILAGMVKLRNTLMHFRIRTAELDHVETILPQINRTLREILTSGIREN